MSTSLPTSLPTSLSDQEVADFHRDGYVIKRAFLNQEENALLRKKADLDHAYEDQAKENTDLAGNLTKLSIWNHPAEDLYGAIARSRRLVDSCSKILNDEVYHWHSKISMKDPGKGAWEWHQDYGYWYEQCLYPDLVSCYIAIDPATKENGCLQVLKKSHLMGRVNHGDAAGQTGVDLERMKLIENNFENIHVELAAGDAVYFHSNTLHRSDYNASKNPRWGLICCFNSKHNSPVCFGKEGHPEYTPLEIYDDKMIQEIGARDIASLVS